MTYVYDIAQLTEVGKPDSGFPDAGSSDVDPLNRIKKNNQNNKQNYQKNQKRQQHAARSDAAVRDRKKRRARQSGIVTYHDDDVAEAEELERKTPADQLSTVVKVVKACGKEPVPGCVAQEIETAARCQVQNSGADKAATRHAGSHAARLRRYAVGKAKN